MITVNHYRVRGRSYRKATSNYGRIAFWREAYATAYAKPNYPLPAIPFDWEYDPEVYGGCMRLFNRFNPGLGWSRIWAKVDWRGWPNYPI